MLQVGDMVVSLECSDIYYQNKIGKITRIILENLAEGKYSHYVSYLDNKGEWAYEDSFRKLTPLEEAML